MPQASLELQNCIALVIEDDDFTRAMHVRSLEKLGITRIVSADNGLEAIKYSQKLPQIDLIVCDLAMPDMDGMEFIPKFTRQFAEISNRDYQTVIFFVSNMQMGVVAAAETLARENGLVVAPSSAKPMSGNALNTALNLLVCEKHSNVQSLF